MIADVRPVAGLTAEFRGKGGPRLVLLHGNGADAREWDKMQPLLGDFETVALEARGHGRTPVGSRPWTIAEMATDLGEALHDLGDAIVLGFSDGANVAMELAIRNPRNIRGLILVGGNLYPSGLRSLVRMTMTAAWAFYAMLGLASGRARRKAQQWALMTLEPRIDPAALHGLDIPALVVAGQRDVIRTSHTALIARSIPGACLVTVPRSGHMLPTTRPAELARLVRGFADSLA